MHHPCPRCQGEVCRSCPPPSPPGAILEAAVYAEDLEPAEGVYGELLGLPRLIRAGARHVFFLVGAGVLRAFDPRETERPPDPHALPVPPHDARGPGHVCFALSRSGIAAMHRRLVAAGVAIEAAFDWPNGARALCVRDPAGDSVAFAEPCLWAG